MAKSLAKPERLGPAIARIHVVMEVLWLAAAGLVPLAMAPEEAMMGHTHVPKVALLRAVATLLLALWVWELVLTPKTSRCRPSLPLGWRFVSWLRENPARWVVVAAVAVLATTVLSVALSPVWRVSLWGQESGSDGYGLYTVVSYIALFLVVATHLKGPQQLQRLLWVIAASGVVVGAYAISQHFGFDPLLASTVSPTRAQSSLGHPIFAGAVLLMTVPVSLAAVLSLGRRFHPVLLILLGTLLVTVQLLGIAFTFSRGPWVGVGVALVVFLVVVGFTLGRRSLITAAAILGLPVLMPVIVATIPRGDVVISSGSQEFFSTRLSSIYGNVNSFGFGGRSTAWDDSSRLAAHRPWYDSDAFPELPSMTARPLRHLVGYGPDMFSYALPLAEEVHGSNPRVGHAHNLLLHQLVELGVLGLLSYLGLLVSLGVAGLIMLFRARRCGYPLGITLGLAAVLAVVAGRSVEQMVGVARVSDFTLFWLLAAILVAIPSLAGSTATAASSPRKPKARQGAAVSLLSPWKPAVASVLTVTLVAFLWQTNLRYVPAAVTAASAEAALQRGNYPESVRLLDRAISQAPSVELYRVYKGVALEAWSSRETDPALKANLLRLAYDEAKEALDWNPLSHRAWARAGEFSRKLGVLDESVREEALRNHIILATLLPGYWQPQNTLAGAYLQFNRPAEALIPIDRSLALNGDSRSTSQALYLLGWALRDLGRPHEAVAVLEKSVDRAPIPFAHGMLAELYDALGEHEKADQSRARYNALLASS